MSWHTCDLVSTTFKQAPVSVFHVLMVLSPVPPPVARVLAWNGHQARALTALVCWVREWSGS